MNRRANGRFSGFLQKYVLFCRWPGKTHCWSFSRANLGAHVFFKTVCSKGAASPQCFSADAFSGFRAPYLENVYVGEVGAMTGALPESRQAFQMGHFTICWGGKMAKVLRRLGLMLLIFGMTFSLAFASENMEPWQIQAELDALKGRVVELEGKLEEQQRPAHNPQGEEKNDHDGKGLLDRFGTLSIHGGVVGYFQGGFIDRIEEEKFKNPAGAGFAADLELTFEPIANGEFFLRIHAGEGEGADKDLMEAEALFANLNTIADDNPGDAGVAFLEVYYKHRFLDAFALTVGKTDFFEFLDDNAFANDEITQFVGKAFVNNPVMDSENEYGPLMGFEWEIMEFLTLSGVVQSTSHPLLDEEEQKSKYDNVFNNPFWGVQATYSPQWNGLEGNYRVYGWTQPYAHPKVEREGTEAGWGVGLSVDQWVHEKVGLFARFGYQNREVYEVPWFWSAGVHLQGIVPNREEDTLGLGVAGLKANDRLDSSGTEMHLETYYRIALSENFAISPHLQYVIHPLGNRDNDNVFAGMLKGEWSF